MGARRGGARQPCAAGRADAARRRELPHRRGDHGRPGRAERAGKTTLLRLVAGDLQPQAGTVTATGGLGVMRQFIGTNQGPRITPMVRDLLLSVSPPRVREAAARLDAAELAMMERDDERAQLRYAAALAEWGEAGGYEAEVHWDACTRGRVRHPVRAVPLARRGHAVRRRAEAAGARVAAARHRRRAAARRAGQLPGRAGQALARAAAGHHAEDRAAGQPRPGTAGRLRAAHRDRRGPARLGARRRLPELRPGPRRPDQPARGTAPPLGRGAREAEGTGPHLAAEGLLQLRHGLPVPGRGDQAAQVRGGRAAAGSPAGAERQDAAARRADRQARRHLREPGADG